MLTFTMIAQLLELGFTDLTVSEKTLPATSVYEVAQRLLRVTEDST